MFDNNQNKKICFYKGKKNILEQNGTEKSKADKDDNNRDQIQKDIVKIFPSSHLSFLLGAGCSFDAIPTMKEMWEKLFDENGNFKENKENQDLKLDEEIEKFNKSNKNLEKLLELLLAKEFYLEKTEKEKTEKEKTEKEKTEKEKTEKEKTEKEKTEKEKISESINEIKRHIFDCVALQKEQKETEGKIKEIEKLYQSFYKKLMYRENNLSKVNIFTTNYDLFNEKAMDDLGIIYCNGFSGNINRYFNPMTFNYAYVEQIGLSDTKYNPLDQYVYLYKLHGSINWIEIETEDEKLFKIKEIQNPCFKEDKNIMIYPTPTKQSSSFSSPYSDLFREFQKKLLQQDNILVVIGYSFADEHINNIIYQALATIPKFRLIIFSYDDKNKGINSLRDLDDPRIWIIQGKDNDNKNIASFKYIVDYFLLEENEEDERIEKALKNSFKKMIKEND